MWGKNNSWPHKRHNNSQFKHMLTTCMHEARVSTGHGTHEHMSSLFIGDAASILDHIPTNCSGLPVGEESPRHVVHASLLASRSSGEV